MFPTVLFISFYFSSSVLFKPLLITIPAAAGRVLTLFRRLVLLVLCCVVSQQSVAKFVVATPDFVFVYFK